MLLANYCHISLLNEHLYKMLVNLELTDVQMFGLVADGIVEHTAV